MNQILTEKINGFGSLFRLITPILLTIIGTLIIGGQNELKKEIEGLKTHFVNHLMHHQDLEVGYEKRITAIENTRFTFKDGDNLHQLIKKELPPKWLVDKVECLDTEVKELKKLHDEDMRNVRKK